MKRHGRYPLLFLAPLLLAGATLSAFQAYPYYSGPSHTDYRQAYGNPYYGDRGYGGPYRQLRALVNRTQNDLRYAAGLPARNRNGLDRIAQAEGHLSSLDRRLSQGRMGRSELHKSIDKLRSILNKNVLDGGSRNALQRDLDELQVAREYRG